jgi:hypothetical protein
MHFNPGGPRVVYLPISDAHLLVGQESRTAHDGAEEINRASVELSREFFVSSRNSERERAYLSRMKLRASLIERDEIVRLATEAVRNL